MDTEMDGLWTVEFSTPIATGSGVVTVRNLSIMGGDSSFYYIGTFARDGSNLRGKLQAKHYSGSLSDGVFGPRRLIDLGFDAALGDDLIIGRLYDAADPIRWASVRMTRVARFS